MTDVVVVASWCLRWLVLGWVVRLTDVCGVGVVGGIVAAEAAGWTEVVFHDRRLCVVGGLGDEGC